MTAGTSHLFSRRRSGRAAPFPRIIDRLNGEGGLLSSRSYRCLPLLLMSDSGTASVHSPQ